MEVSQSTILPNYRLGALAAQVRDKQPIIDKLHMFARMAPPTLNKDTVALDLIMGDNDKIGDCTAVGLVNSANALQAMNRSSLPATDQDAVDFYEQSTGYSPADLTTDKGGVESDVLGYAVKNGIMIGQQRLMPIFGTFDESNQNNLALCTTGLSSTYLGLQLALADQQTIGSVWDTTTPGDQTPGGWGGHCALLWAYDGLAPDSLVRILTWKTQQRATWRWVMSRITEAHGVLWPQLASPTGAFLNQADYNQVREANVAFIS
jgi:hypothetical protein